MLLSIYPKSVGYLGQWNIRYGAVGKYGQRWAKEPPPKNGEIWSRKGGGRGEKERGFCSILERKFDGLFMEEGRGRGENQLAPLSLIFVVSLLAAKLAHIGFFFIISSQDSWGQNFKISVKFYWMLRPAIAFNKVMKLPRKTQLPVCLLSFQLQMTHIVARLHWNIQ